MGQNRLTLPSGRIIKANPAQVSLAGFAFYRAGKAKFFNAENPRQLFSHIESFC